MTNSHATDRFGAELTMARMFRSVAERFPNRPAVVDADLRLTFAELDRRTDGLAEALRQRGVVRRSLVGAVLLDGIAMVEMLLATAKLGATILAMNWRLAPPELAYIIEDANPSLCFVSECFRTLFDDAAPGRERILVADHDPGGAGGALGVTEDSPRLARDTPVFSDDVWYMLYTSGTEGNPKGCQHTQGGYYVNAISYAAWAGFVETDCLLASSPLFHVGGLCTFLGLHVSGACAVFPRRGIGVAETLRLVVDEGVTVQTLPPLQSEEYLDLQARLQLPHRLRLIVSGGGMNAVKSLEKIRDTLQVDIILGYGQSEGGGFITFLRLQDQLERPTSCGRLLPNWSGRIVDDDGKDVQHGQAGELLLRGPSATIGYNNLPEATAAALAGGWLHTGDYFRRDEDGFLYFSGRKKELVKTGGENVYPAEVEAVMNRHPAIVDSCIVGVPDRRYGEAVKAFVVLKHGSSLTPGEVADWCRQSIAGYKRPRFVEFVEKIPRDYNGKPLRLTMSGRPVTTDQACAPGK